MTEQRTLISICKSDLNDNMVNGGSNSLHGLHGDCVQHVIDYLGIVEEFAFLSFVSSHLRSLREECNFSHINDAKLKRFIGKVLNESVHQVCIRSFGKTDKSEMKCADIRPLVQIFRSLSPSMTSNSEIYTLKVAASHENHIVKSMKSKISPKSIRSAHLLYLTDEHSGIWVSICAFQCSESRSTVDCYSPYSRRPCHGSYFIGKCSTISCDQPYFECPNCAINCYDCNMAGLCTNCILETPNSGEIVFVCIPCRGYWPSHDLAIWRKRESGEASRANQYNIIIRQLSKTVEAHPMVTGYRKLRILIELVCSTMAES